MTGVYKDDKLKCARLFAVNQQLTEMGSNVRHVILAEEIIKLRARLCRPIVESDLGDKNSKMSERGRHTVATRHQLTPILPWPAYMISMSLMQPEVNIQTRSSEFGMTEPSASIQGLVSEARGRNVGKEGDATTCASRSVQLAGVIALGGVL
jgi:hypothetical protein